MNTNEDNTIQNIKDIIEVLPFLISGVPLLIAIIFLNCFQINLFIAVPLFLFAFIISGWLLFSTIENKKIISDKIISIYNNENKNIKLFILFLIFILSILFFVFLLFFYNPRI